MEIFKIQGGPWPPWPLPSSAPGVIGVEGSDPMTKMIGWYALSCVAGISSQIPLMQDANWMTQPSPLDSIIKSSP